MSSKDNFGRKIYKWAVSQHTPIQSDPRLASETHCGMFTSQIDTILVDGVRIRFEPVHEAGRALQRLLRW